MPTADEIPAEIYEIISNTYTDEGCVIWWNGSNLNLYGRSPKDCWERGFRYLVEETAELLEVGFSG